MCFFKFFSDFWGTSEKKKYFFRFFGDLRGKSEKKKNMFSTFGRFGEKIYNICFFLFNVFAISGENLKKIMFFLFCLRFWWKIRKKYVFFDFLSIFGKNPKHNFCFPIFGDFWGKSVIFF